MYQEELRGVKYLAFVGLGVDVSQLLVDRHGLTELHRPLKHFLETLLGAIHVLQVEQGHPHVQLLLLLPGTTQRNLKLGLKRFLE